MGLVPGGYRRDLEWMTEVSIATGLRTTLAVTQHNVQPELWRDVLDWVDEAAAAGARVTPQVAGRPLGILLGWTTRHQFSGRPSYDEVAHLPLAERVVALADPERRARILAEPATPGLATLVAKLSNQLFPLYDPPDYEPPAERRSRPSRQRPAARSTRRCTSSIRKKAGVGSCCSPWAGTRTITPITSWRCSSGLARCLAWPMAARTAR